MKKLTIELPDHLPADLPKKRTNTGLRIHAHEPHGQQCVTDHMSYPEILKKMNEAKTDVLPFCDDHTVSGEVHRHDVVGRMTALVEHFFVDLDNFAHDVKHPLTIIKGINYLLTRPAADDEDVNRLLSKSNEACQYVAELLNEFISGQKEQNQIMKLQSTDFNEFLADCLSTYKLQLKQKDIFLYKHFHPEKILCELDIIKFHRVVDNLITNAIKFTPRDGRIDVSTYKTPAGFSMVVSDDGMGIDVADQERIFERYSAARKQGTEGEHSTGLGLNITREIIRAHNGEIMVSSSPGLGSRFTVDMRC